jgi:hypothetical protein
MMLTAFFFANIHFFTIYLISFHHMQYLGLFNKLCQKGKNPYIYPIKKVSI